MEVDELAQLAKALSKDQFEQRFDHLFLLFDRPNWNSAPLEFETQVAERRTRPSLLANVLRVVPVTKTPGSPYPDRISLGRARNCDVPIRDGSISKLHAHVRRDADGGWSLVDLGSHNGTLVRGEKIAPNQPEKLKSGDLVTLGAITVRVVDAAGLFKLLTGG